jgi:predicted transcriptional regulator
MAESVRSAVQRQLDQLASGIEVLAVVIIRRSIIDAQDCE